METRNSCYSSVNLIPHIRFIHPCIILAGYQTPCADTNGPFGNQVCE